MNKYVLCKKQLIISTAYGIYIYHCALTGYLITSLSLKFLPLPSVHKLSWPCIMSSNVITFTNLNPRRVAPIFRTKFRLLSDVTTVWTPSWSVPNSQQHFISNFTPTKYSVSFKEPTQSDLLFVTNVTKQVTYTNTEQETNSLPVCNIPAVTHYIDRWVLIGRVESNEASFLANGYFLRVFPTHCRILSNSINIHKPSQLVQLLKIGMFSSSKTDIRYILDLPAGNYRGTIYRRMTPCSLVSECATEILY